MIRTTGSMTTRIMRRTRARRCDRDDNDNKSSKRWCAVVWCASLLSYLVYLNSSPHPTGLLHHLLLAACFYSNNLFQEHSSYLQTTILISFNINLFFADDTMIEVSDAAAWWGPPWWSTLLAFLVTSSSSSSPLLHRPIS